MIRAGVAIRTQRAVDPVLLVVRGHDDVQTQAVLPSRVGSAGAGVSEPAVARRRSWWAAHLAA